MCDVVGVVRDFDPSALVSGPQRDGAYWPEAAGELLELISDIVSWV